ncbi:MAG: hypothetical protein ACQEXJ_03625 [Myxococcota bacterium]
MPHRRLLTALLALVTLGAAGGPAGAADALPEAGWRTLEVAVLPVRSYVRGPEDLFEDRPAVRRLRERAGLWQRRLEQSLAARDLVDTLPATESAEHMTRRSGYREALLVARERLTLGIERYRELQIDEALRHLQRADELYHEAWAGVANPREMADVSFYRGLAHMDRGDVNRAHIAFRNLWLLDPSRRIDQGYYPKATEEALAGALEDLASLPDKLLTRFPLDRVESLAAELDVDAVAVALVDGTVDAPVLRIAIFEARGQGLALDERIALDDPEQAEDHLERAVSAWHTCAIRARQRPLVRRRRKPRWYVDVGYAHTLMVRHERTRDLFHSPGAAIGVTWEGKRAFHLYGQMVHMASVPDPNRDLIHGFATSRLALGAGLTGGNRRVRVFVQVGAELAVTFSDIEMSTDVDCKHFPDSDRCSGLFVQEAPSVGFGLDFGVGLKWAFTRSWYLQTRANVVSYLASQDLASELNFPVSLAVGIGNRF